MRFAGDRVPRVLCVLLVLAVAGARVGAAFAQADEATPSVSGVDGNAYTSPQFGYGFTWDDAVWSAGDEASDDGYDSLHLSSEGADLFVEGFYFYRGNPEDCLDGEQAIVADDDGLSGLDPLSDADGTPIAGGDDGSAYALFAYPEGASAENAGTDVLLDCRTLIPDAAVIVITGFFADADADAKLDAISAVTDTLTLVPGDGEPGGGSDDVEQIDREAETAVDDFWTRTFADLGETYQRPAFVTFTGPDETPCGDATPGESGPFYCPDDRTVYYDLQMMTDEMLPFGGIVLEMVVAHEIGHHVQNLLGLDGCTDEVCGPAGASLAIELQADCFAGSWMRDAAAEGTITASDIKRVDLAVETYFGDPPETPLDDPDAHGSGDTRDAMFHQGYENGVTACGLS